jgi:O-antigen ligase
MIETFALCPFLAALPFEEYTTMGVSILRLAGGLALVVWLFSHLRPHDAIRWDTGLTLMLLFVIWGAASGFWSISPAVSWDRLPTYVLLLVSYFLVVNVIRDERQLSVAMTAWWVGTLVLVASGVSGLSAVQSSGAGARLGGIVGNANAYVAMLVSCIPCCYWALTRTRAPFLKIVTAVALLAAVITSFYSKSRGGFVSIVVFFLSLLAFRQTRRRAIGFAALFLALALRLGSLGLWQRMDEARLQRGDDRTASLWPAGLKAFGQRPLFGSGLGTNYQAVASFGAWQVVHNSPLAVAIELGLVGLALYCALLTYGVVRLWRAITAAMRQGKAREAGFAIVLLASFLGYMTTWFKGGGMEYSKMVWVLLGLMNAYSRMLEQPPGTAGTRTRAPIEVRHDYAH